MRAFVGRLVFPTILGLLIVVSLTALRIATPHITTLSTPADAVRLPIAEIVLRLRRAEDKGSSGARTWTSTSITVTVSTGAITGPNRCQDSGRGWVLISSGGSRRAAIHA